ncbi:MAG TPA: c-type cytochrome [Gemmatimonadales bacterium]|nr:c-type cytochrome [Gemmatimonadales bacterium]
MRLAMLAVGLGALALTLGCRAQSGRQPTHAAAPPNPQGVEVATLTGAARTDSADTSAAPPGVLPGIHPRFVYGALRNPHGPGDRAAAAEGRKLFLQYNCDGCHGSHAGGGMGPGLRDQYWIYGNDDAQLFSTIAEGRSKGMPAWGARLPEDQVWKLISYIRTLGTPAEPEPPPQGAPEVQARGGVGQPPAPPR